MEGDDVQAQPNVPIAVERKILVVGNRGCGKTCLIASFLTERPMHFTEKVPKDVRRTISFGRESVPVVLREGEANPNYYFVRRMHYAGASAALVCFSFNDIESMRSVPQWIDEVREYCRSADLTVVGCKLDQKHKTPITPPEWICIEKVITPYKYLECSAMTGEGVSHLVRVVGNALLNQIQRENIHRTSFAQH